jgi:hypothetical protein
MNNFKKVTQDLVNAAGLTLNGCGTLLVKTAELSPKAVAITIDLVGGIVPTAKAVVMLPVTTLAQCDSVNNKTDFDVEYAARVAKLPKSAAEAVNILGIALGNAMSDV